MDNRHLLNEEKLPAKLPVVYSNETMNTIEAIKDSNRFEEEGLSRLFAYINGISSHISNRAIAFGYGNNYTIDSNETVYVRDFGVIFSLKDGTNGTFVEIAWIDLNPEEFGLEVPPMMEGKKKIVRLTEKDLHRIVKESVKRILFNKKVLLCN